MKKYLIWIIGIAVLILFGVYFYFQDYFQKDNAIQQVEQKQIVQKEKIENLKNIDDIKKRFYEMSPEERKNLKLKEKVFVGKALSNYYFLDQKVMIDSLDFLVAALKDDTNITLKVAALNKLGNYYDDAARSEAVVQKMYSYEELKPYLEKAGGDYNLAGRYIFEDSYKLLPCPYSAVMLAKWYAIQILKGDLDKKTKKEYLKKMQEYVKAYRSFIKNGYKPNKPNSYWSTFPYAVMCKEGHKEYCQPYRDIIDKRSPNSSWPKLMSAYYYYLIDGDKNKAKENIDSKIELYNRLGDKTSLAKWWNNERKREKYHDLMYKVIIDMMEISPKFKEYIKSIEK